MNKAEIIPIFPSPVYVTMLEPLTPQEMDYVRGLQHRPNQGGNTTSTDDFILNSGMLNYTKQQIEHHLAMYLKNVINPVNDVSLYITQSWINNNKKDTYHHKHSHGNSVVSGCFYIEPETPPAILFHRRKDFGILDNMEPKELNPFNSFDYRFTPKKNVLILFPSTLAHSVEYNEQDEERISLAFNTFMRGTVGSRESLTYLELR